MGIHTCLPSRWLRNRRRDPHPPEGTRRWRPAGVGASSAEGAPNRVTCRPSTWRQLRVRREPSELVRSDRLFLLDFRCWLHLRPRRWSRTENKRCKELSRRKEISVAQISPSCECSTLYEKLFNTAGAHDRLRRAVPCLLGGGSAESCQPPSHRATELA